MAINKKGKRKISVDGVNYWWKISMDRTYTNGNTVKVISDDQKFNCFYSLEDVYNGKRYMVSFGELFGGIEYEKKTFYHCPRWENENWSITPKGVAEFICLCLSEEKELIQVK